MQGTSEKKARYGDNIGTETAQPSMLNFDITGDVTREVTDIEAARTSTVTPVKPNNNKNIPIRSRNSDAMMFADPNNAETGTRVHVMTAGMQEIKNYKKATPGILEDHHRNASSMTQPPQTPPADSPIVVDKQESLQSFDFEGSQFRPPSDAEN